MDNISELADLRIRIENLENQVFAITGLLAARERVEKAPTSS